MIDQVNTPRPDDGNREEIELLLPWYVNGTLEEPDITKVEAYLEHHPNMQAQLATLREDLDEAITANETIAGPSGAALDRLMQQIKAEAPVRHQIAKAKRSFMEAVDEFLRSLSPGRLGWAAMAAAAVIMLQAGVVGTMMLNPPSSGSTIELAGENEQPNFVFLVQFKQDASVADISAFLSEESAEIISGPAAGLFRVRIAAKNNNDDTREALLAKLRSNEELINTVLLSQ